MWTWKGATINVLVLAVLRTTPKVNLDDTGIFVCILDPDHTGFDHPKTTVKNKTTVKKTCTQAPPTSLSLEDAKLRGWRFG